MSTENRDTNETQLSREKRNALLRYIEILFLVAFVLVAVSLFAQMRTTKTTLSDMNHASESMLSKAEDLQDQNRRLLDDNTALRAQIAAQTAKNQDMKIAYDALANVLASPYSEETIEYSRELETVYNYRDLYSEAAWSLFETYIDRAGAMAGGTP